MYSRIKKIFFLLTAFLGYVNSPKWLIYNNLNLFISIILFLLLIYLLIILVPDILITKQKFKIKRNYYNNNKLCKKNNLFSRKIKIPISISRSYNKELRYYSTNNFKNKDISNGLQDIIKELDINPIFIFENLNLEITRKQILNDTKGLSGIYMIVNKISKDYYVGSASTNRFYSRFSNHLIYLRGSKILKLVVKKYSLNNFAFLILELYPNVITKENNKELLGLEDKYLKLLLPNYNILTKAGSSFGYKHTEIDRQKMKDIYNDIRWEKIGNLNRGKKLKPEIIEKLRQIALNRPPMSDEVKKKCISNGRPVTLYNLNRTVYGKYISIRDAAKAINCSEKTIRRALKTAKKLVKRQWVVKDINNKFN